MDEPKTQHHISMDDNTDRDPSEHTESNAQMLDAENKMANTEEQTKTAESGAAGETYSSAWHSHPERLGNKAGESIESGLTPVKNTVGKGLETIGKPVGGIVDPLVGGVMRGGKAVGEQTGLGFGNHEGGPAKAAEKEGQRMKEPIGGKEQTGDNPLGL